MSSVNGMPSIQFGGINDLSRGTNPREPVAMPQHAPLIRLFTQTGPTATTFVGGANSSITDVYGVETLNRRSKYFNTNSLLAETLLGEGNGVWIKRLKPTDAGNPARIILALDIVNDLVPNDRLTLPGFNYPGDTDDTLPLPASINGFRARWVLIEDNETEVGRQEVVPGGFVNAANTQSTLYPILELPVSFFGEEGNLNGFRMWPVLRSDPIRPDEDMMEEFKTRVYRFQFLKKLTAAASPQIVRTPTGDDYVEATFAKDAFSRSSELNYDVATKLISSYTDDGFLSGLEPRFSPFEELYVYYNNLELIQSMVYDTELDADPSLPLTASEHTQIDIFGGVDLDGNQYKTLYLEGAMDGGILLTSESVVYATGGSDGTMNHDTYEELVDQENLFWGQLEDDYENEAYFPFTKIYDMGLSMQSKYRQATVLSKHQSIELAFTTFVEKDGRAPTRSEEISRLQALMARLRAQPESTLYSTPAVRADIYLQTGELASGGYTKPVPQLLDVAAGWARMSGAANGQMRGNLAIDVEPNNEVRLIKNLNVPFFNQIASSEIWTNGGSVSSPLEPRVQYYACHRTIYNDATSVLISPITRSICCDIIRLAKRVHKSISGNAALTKAQIIEISDNTILRLVDRRYAGRVTIVPETYFTPEDDARGFSWRFKVKVYANNPRTTMFFDVETYRADTLGQ